MTDNLLVFWGKTPSSPTAAADQYHPAIYHMLDVGMVAAALLTEASSPRLRRVLFDTWAGVRTDELLAWLPLLIATHDIGKISAAFQGMANDRRTTAQRERLEQTGITFPPTYSNPPYHAEVSAIWLHDHLQRREAGTTTHLMWVLRDAMGGHHGRFTQDSMRDIRQRLTKSERQAPAWADWRDATYSLLRSILTPAMPLANLGAPQHIRPATVALTGFIILCDWIGSNDQYFPAAPNVPLSDYPDLARQRAALAVQQAGLGTQRTTPTYTTFTATFPTISQPRPLQKAVDSLPDEVLTAPLLAIIEAPTGEGKTEAALALARRLGAHETHDELFFALPTMATSNQMFGRLEAFFQRLAGSAVRLTHSQAAVSEDELRRAALAGDREDTAASARAAIEWFAGPKKAMLAPFGVGTVDQVELAGLHVRHYMLRLFALAGKVVIIDEVHAYDAYMSTILEHTLAWLASMGTSVFLLSATLPANRHHALATSFLHGLYEPSPSIVLPDPLPYPVLSLYRASHAPYRVAPAAFRTAQHLTLRLQERQSAQHDAQHLLDLVRHGGAVARICNRVDDAQAIFAELRALQSGSAQHILLHARMPLGERTRREQTIAAWVGNATTRTPDQPLIIVGTQVLEQSLDYDVDVMVSDFAPIDLLLQRAGRLHRHTKRTNQRPIHHRTPVLEVMLHTNDTGLPNWTGWEHIYDPYILWRTWEVLHTKRVGNECPVVLPRDYRPLIEAVYQHTPQVQANTPYTPAMTKALHQLQQKHADMTAHARQHLTPPVYLRDAITETTEPIRSEDEDGARAGWHIAKTRLGDRITVVLLYRIGDTLALDAGGTWQLSPDHPPRHAEQLKAILARSVPISHPRVIAIFRDETRRPQGWHWAERDTPPLLRSVFPLVLDTNHTAIIEGITLRLDPDLGLVIT